MNEESLARALGRLEGHQKDSLGRLDRIESKIDRLQWKVISIASGVSAIMVAAYHFGLLVK